MFLSDGFVLLVVTMWGIVERYLLSTYSVPDTLPGIGSGSDLTK